jgi:hypothetical protein
VTQSKKLLENSASNILKFSFNKLLAFALISNPAMANWEYIATNDKGNHFFVSSESIKSSGWNKRTAWELINYPSDTSTKPYKSGIVQQEYECSGYKVRTLFASTHSELFGKGEVLYRDSSPRLSWVTMPKISVATQARDYICNKHLSSK